MPTQLLLHQYFLSIFLLNIKPRLVLDLLHGLEALLYTMCLISFNLPGFEGRPFLIHHLLHFLLSMNVVNPKISTFTPHLSRVLVNISALNAATVIGLPLIDPELSINKVTIVSLNSDCISSLYDKD